MQVTCAERKVGGHVSCQSLSHTASITTALGVGWLVRLRIVVRMVTTLLQPAVVGIISLPLTEVVEPTAGSNHCRSKAKVKITSF